MDGIRTEGEFWRRALTYLSDLLAQWASGVTINNSITEPIPVQQADLNDVPDEYVLCITPVTGGIDTHGALSYKEF